MTEATEATATTGATAGANAPQTRAASDSQHRRRHVVVSLTIVAAAILLIGLLSYGLMLDPHRVPPANIDKAAYAFTVPLVQGKENQPLADGTQVTLADLKGHPVVLNFWASWCVSCREEAKELEAFWQGHKDQVMVVGIAIQDTQEAAKKFAAYFGKTYTLGLDADGKAAIDYGVSGVPETFLIDKNGVIRHKEIGPVTVKKLEELLPVIL
jgi:cytochrome c biogenesis protein CcmG/thiol:disulfide interchange protein DsbE